MSQDILNDFRKEKALKDLARDEYHARREIEVSKILDRLSHVLVEASNRTVRRATINVGIMSISALVTIVLDHIH